MDTTILGRSSKLSETLLFIYLAETIEFETNSIALLIR